MVYAKVTEKEFEQLAPFREEREKLIKKYHEIDKKTSDQKLAANQFADQSIDAIRKEQKEALAGFTKNYLSLRDQIQKTTDSQLGREIQTGEDIEGNNARFIEEGKKNLKEAEKNYLEGKKNMIKPFDERIEKVKKDRNASLESFNQDKQIALTTFYQDMLSLHQKAYKVYIGK